MVLTTGRFIYEFDEKGRVLRFENTATGENFARDDGYAFYLVNPKLDWQGDIAPLRSELIFPVSVLPDGDGVEVTFDQPAIRFHVTFDCREDHIRMKVDKITDGVYFQVFVFGGCRLRDGEKMEYGGCAVNRVLRVNMLEHPGFCDWVGACCYYELSPLGAEAAICAGDAEGLRHAIIHATEDVPATEIIQNPYGGAYAKDAPGVHDDYLISMTEVDLDKGEWLENMRYMGMQQKDFHQGCEFRQGDYRFLPEKYPNDAHDFKRFVSDKLHENGMGGGLHIYSGMLDPLCKFVSPVPSPDLAVYRSYTLGADLGEDDDALILFDPTDDIRPDQPDGGAENKAVLRIDEELVAFTGVSENGLTGLTRGMFGTRRSAHKAGTKADHLLSMYSYFLATPETKLFYDLCAETARAYNEGGFDFIYFDGLECVGASAGFDRGRPIDWYYESLFVREVLNKLDHPALAEFSIFHTGLWAGRSRAGAFDSCNSDYASFFDWHCDYLETDVQRRLLPSQMGWFHAYPTVWDIQRDVAPNWGAKYPYEDDMDNLCCKTLAYESGLSCLLVAPELTEKYRRYGDMIAQIAHYRPLRRNNTLTDAQKKRMQGQKNTWRLCEDGKTFAKTNRAFARPYGLSENNGATVENPLPSQRPTVRLIGGYTGKPDEERPIVTLDRNIPLSETERRYVFDEPGLSIKGREALCIDVKGNGKDEYIDIRLSCFNALAEHLINTNFEGWRRFILCESDNDFSDSVSLRPLPVMGPYHAPTYAKHRELIRFNEIHAIEILTSGEGDDLYVGSLYAIPYTMDPIKNPGITVGGETVRFDVDLVPGEYLVYKPGDPSAKRYDQYGYQCEVAATGSVGVLPNGKSDIFVHGEGDGNFRLRVHLLTEQVYED